MFEFRPSIVGSIQPQLFIAGLMSQRMPFIPASLGNSDAASHSDRVLILTGLHDVCTERSKKLDGPPM